MSYNCPILAWMQNSYSVEKSMNNYELMMVIATFSSVIVTIFLVAAAWKQLSKLSEKSKEEHDRIRRKATIENLGNLWERTQSKMKDIPNLKDIKYTKTDYYPNDYKCVIQIFETFERMALGVLKEVYDKNLFYDMVGNRKLKGTCAFFKPHIINLIIDSDGKFYSKFEQLVEYYNNHERNPCDNMEQAPLI